MPSKLVIKTNLNWKEFSYRREVPEKVLKNDLSWTTEEDENSYLKYLGTWHHLSEFMRFGEEGSTIDGTDWDASLPTSAWTGVLIKIDSESGRYRIGTVRQVG